MYKCLMSKNYSSLKHWKEPTPHVPRCLYVLCVHRAWPLTEDLCTVHLYQ